jgi:hypothetical protein
MIPSSPPAGANSLPNDRPRPDTAVYAYTITRWSLPDPAAPVRVVAHRDIAMLVADVDPAEFTEPAMVELVRRHHTVVRDAFRHGAVLPLRFATMFADGCCTSATTRSSAISPRSPATANGACASRGRRPRRRPA